MIFSPTADGSSVDPLPDCAPYPYGSAFRQPYGVVKAPGSLQLLANVGRALNWLLPVSSLPVVMSYGVPEFAMTIGEAEIFHGSMKFPNNMKRFATSKLVRP